MSVVGSDLMRAQSPIALDHLLALPRVITVPEQRSQPAHEVAIASWASSMPAK